MCLFRTFTLMAFFASLFTLIFLHLFTCHWKEIVSGSTLCLWFHLMSLSLIPCFLMLFPVVWWLWGKLYNEVSFNLVGVELFAVFSYSLAPDRLPHVCMRHHDYVIGCNVCVRGASVLAPLSLREETPNNTETSVYFVPWSDGLSSQWISCEHLWRCQSSLLFKKLVLCNTTNRPWVSDDTALRVTGYGFLNKVGAYIWHGALSWNITRFHR